MKLVCSSSHATGLCMIQDPLCLSGLRQGRVPHDVFLETMFVHVHQGDAQERVPTEGGCITKLDTNQGGLA